MASKAKRIVLAIGVLAAACTLVLPAAASVRRPAAVSRALEADVLRGVNDVRVAHGLAPLRLSAKLTTAADAHSAQMAADGYFAHDSADHSAFWKRVQHFYGSAGYGFWAVGENLLWSSPDVDGAGALKMWMESPEHRANLLDPRWREIGLSGLHVQSAPGVFGGLEVTIVTAEFGVRR